MVQYQEGKFIDESEITVEQWAEFVLDGHEARKPDSLISSQFSYHQIFYPSQPADSLYRAYGKISYYQLPVPFPYFDSLSYLELRSILDFPITGISFDDVQAYCAWRTERYNAKNTSHTKQTIHYTLPDSIVIAQLSELFIENKNHRPIPIANLSNAHYQRTKDAPNKKVFETIGKQAVKTKSFPPNTHQVFDLYGNVAEMTNQKGKAIGGSYQSQSTTPLYYSQPENWLGFRCVGIVRE